MQRSHLYRALAALALTARLDAGTAVLECVADTWLNGRGAGQAHALEAGEGSRALLDFRFSAIKGWNVKTAVLILHVAGGDAPQRLHIGVIRSRWDESAERVTVTLGPLRPIRSEAVEQGWIRVTLPAGLVQAAMEGRGFGLVVSARGRLRLSSRESGYPPSLLVDGVPQSLRASVGLH